ncbi:MAG: AAA family ATPase [Acidimicrobiales bacterium]
MFLRTLTLRGFKSFAEPVTIEFEPGVTAVVGPNGSGKSNVVDAVAWVLGAQGPRSVRSGRMDDVIFAGNGRRGPLGRAEVSLTIDNSAGLLALDVAEITITRTLFRTSGESEYALNGVGCRLLDLQELLSDSGVGRTQHVIVSQGQLEAVLDARPEERRLVVEEAAGIVKFRRRKERAERRLAAAEENLSRLADLAGEVNRQLKPLRRQAEAARRYTQLAAEVAELRLFLAGRQIHDLRLRRAAAQSEVRCCRDRLDTLLGRMGTSDGALVEAEGQLTGLGSDSLAVLAGGLGEVVARARGLEAVISERVRSVEVGQRSLSEDLVRTEAAASAEDSLRLARDLAGVKLRSAEVAARLAAMARAAESGSPSRGSVESSSLAATATGADTNGGAMTGAETNGGAMTGGEMTGGAMTGGAMTGGDTNGGEMTGGAPPAAGYTGADAAMEQKLRDRTGRIRGELDALGVSLDRAVLEQARVAQGEDRRSSRRVQVAHRLAQATDERAHLAHLVEESVARLDRSRVAEAEAEAVVATRAREAAGIKESQDRHSARVEAVALAMAEAGGAGSTAPATSGLVGTLSSLLEIDPGWEPAFEAVVAEAEQLWVMDSVASARRALTGSASALSSVQVLALGTGAKARSTTARAPGGDSDGGSAAKPGDLPDVGPQGLASPAWLADRVRVRPGLDSEVASALAGVLDGLLADVVACAGDWHQGLDLAVEHPDRVAVTASGDRFGPGGWRVGGRGRAAAKAALAASEEALSRARQSAQEAGKALDDARAGLAAARDARVAAEGELVRIQARLAAAEAALTGLAAEMAGIDTEAAAASGHARELAARVEAESLRRQSLAQELVGLETTTADLGARREAADQARRQAEAADQARRAAMAAADRARRQAEAVLVAEQRQRAEARARERSAGEREAGVLAERAASLEREIQTGIDRRQQAGIRAEAIRRELATAAARARRLEQARILVADQRTTAEAVRVAVEGRRQAEDDHRREVVAAIADLRSHREALESDIERARQELRESELSEADCAIRAGAAVEGLRGDLDSDPEVAVSAGVPATVAAGTDAGAHLRTLERELRLLGPVNALAAEELVALTERSEFLAAQIEDVRTARRELRGVIRGVETAMRERLETALADVARHFETIFATLFPGGRGRLTLTDPNDILATGLEMDARPAGKNVRRLTLLSGGERSLCALAFLFAVFRSRPSPFYLLDEVEAALDDINLGRFLALLDDFRDEAQLVVVTHQKRTMEAADCLYGVTMAPGGSTQVISERLRAAAS